MSDKKQQEGDFKDEKIVLEEFSRIKEAFEAHQKKRDENRPLTLEDLMEEEAGPAVEEETVARSETGGKRAKKTRFSKKKIRINWKKLLRAGIIAALIVGVAGLGVVAMVVKDAPKINPDNIYELLSENSIIYDSEGQVIDNVFSGSALRTNVQYQELPEHLVDAFVAIEDKTFFSHKGFNYIRIFGAIWDGLSRGQRISGTSTITQQLARNLYLADSKSERTLDRKVKEAYYTVLLEKALSKEQIIEAYLNTIYLGFNSNGVQAASTAYFSKDVGDLTLNECAMLASLPQLPNDYAPLKRIATEDIVDMEALDVVETDDDWTLYYNDRGQDRMLLTLYLMHDQGKISDEAYEEAKELSIRTSINPGTGILNTQISSFFTGYVADQVVADLSRELGIDEDRATELIYNGGLHIYSTLSAHIQDIIEEEYAKTANFPNIGYATKDKEGNFLDSRGGVLLYNSASYFDAEGRFTLKEGEFQKKEDGSLLILKGHRLNIYKTSVQGETDYSLEFKNLYELQGGILYSRAGGAWSIPSEYKHRTEEGDLLLSADFFRDKPEVLVENEDGTFTLDSGHYVLKQPIMQPQSAMVIMDHKNGHILGMIGGRAIQGRRLFNRATAARQPGSAIKPLSVYSVALQSGLEGLGNWTAATPVDDIPIKYGGAAWPKNWYAGYTGINTLRRAVEQSINACSVNTWMQLDPDMSVDFLRNMGVTTLVEYGDVNDINASALALGGMTKGISPLEMTGAFGTFGNDGVYIEPVCYTKVTNRNGDVLLEKKPITRQVMDPSVASLMTNIMQSTVTNGIASGARIAAQPVAGKTGTTSERYDVWFCGLTPQYAAATWIGNDVNIPMDQGSGAAASLWSRVMQRVCAGLPREEFQMKGDFVQATVDRISGKPPSGLTGLDPRGTLVSDIFIKGTVPGSTDDAHVVVSVCAESGYLATPQCPHAVDKLAVIRPGGSSWERILVEFPMPNMKPASIPDAFYDAPEYYCPLHNPNPASYPISTFADQPREDNPALIDPEEEEEEEEEVPDDPVPEEEEEEEED